MIFCAWGSAVAVKAAMGIFVPGGFDFISVCLTEPSLL